MGPRAAIVLGALSAVLLIGCDSLFGENNVSPDLGALGRDLSAQFDGAFCVSTIVILPSPSPAPGLPVYPPVDLIATASGNTNALEKPEWNGTGPDGATFMPEVLDTASGTRVRYHATLPGSYTFRVNFPDSGCRGEKTYDLTAMDARIVAYRFRVSPPTSSGIPQQDFVVNVKGKTPSSSEDLTLLKGSSLSGTLRGPGGTPIAGEVRLLGDNVPDALALAGSSGAFAVAVSDTLKYTPLLIPTDSSLAPGLLAPSTGLAALSALAYSVDAGQLVSGTVRDAANAVLPGVKVVLRSGKLPSGVGLSGANGSYSLRAQAGTFTASIGADGWPELTLPSVTVPATLDVSYLVTRTSTAASVLDTTGKPLAGARVTVRSPVIANAATVNSAAVSGRLKQVLVSMADGSLPGLMLVGAGNYDVLIEPKPGASGGVTSLNLAAAATWSLQLLPKVTLSGKVTDTSGVAVGSVKVTAFETAGLGAAPTSYSQSDGTFTIQVDPGSALEMLYEPPGSTNLSSLRQVVAAGATDTVAALPKGLRIGGSVIQGSSKLPQVVVQALCGSCGSDAPIASALSDGSGAYAIYLPDPGTSVSDGGVNDASP